MKALKFNRDLCYGCRACELACAFAKEAVFSPSRSRIYIVKDEESGTDTVVGCLHCAEAPCLVNCPVDGAMRRDDSNGAVLIDEGLCTGCRLCIGHCPDGAIQDRLIRYDERADCCRKCDLCGGDPECAKWCETGAIAYC